jgi:hypothetical protein
MHFDRVGINNLYLWAFFLYSVHVMLPIYCFSSDGAVRLVFIETFIYDKFEFILFYIINIFRSTIPTPIYCCLLFVSIYTIYSRFERVKSYNEIIFGLSYKSQIETN